MRGERRQDELVCEKKLREVGNDNKGVWEERETNRGKERQSIDGACDKLSAVANLLLFRGGYPSGRASAAGLLPTGLGAGGVPTRHASGRGLG